MLIHNPIFTGSIQLNGTDISQISTVSNDSSSFASRITNTESTASAFILASGSFSTRTTLAEATASALVTASGSLSTRVTAAEATASAFITASGSLVSRIASNEAKTGSFATTGSNQFNGSQTVTGSLTATGTIVAQTLVVQTITSSVDFVTGSNRFGSTTGNTHEFTGSVLVSGSQTINGTLSGIGATFSGTSLSLGANTNGNTQLTINSTSSTAQRIAFQVAGVDQWLVGSGAANQNTNFEIYNAAGTVVLSLNKSTNAATFASSIAAGGGSSFTVGSGTLSSDILVVKGGGSSGAFGFSVQANNGDKLLYTDNLAYNVIMGTTGGKVGIGTTIPTAKLQITNTSAGAATVGLFLNNNSATTNTEIRLGFAANTNDDIATNRYSYISSINTSASNGQALLFATNETGASAVERMRITSGGNVGIGTTSPSAPLHIYGNSTTGGLTLKLSSKDNIGDNWVGFYQNDGTRQGYIGYGYSAYNYFEIYQEGTEPIMLSVNGTERMRITGGSGNDVVIGLAGGNPYTAASRGSIFLNGSTNSLYGWGTGGTARGYMYHEGTNVYMENSVSGGAFNVTQVGAGTINFSTNAATRMTVQSDGGVVIGRKLGNQYSQTSSTGTTSIVDTGITYNTGDYGGYNRGATYQVVFNGNPNAGGSGGYFAQHMGIIMIYTGWSGSAVTTYIQYTQLSVGNNISTLTLTPHFWNGSSQVSSIGTYTTGYQIRLRIDGYNSSYVGSDQSVYLTRLS
jgi:hypothetical protein